MIRKIRIAKNLTNTTRMTIDGSRPCSMPPWFAGLVVTCIIVLGISIWCRIQFGSISVALDALSNRQLRLDPPTIHLGNLDSDRVISIPISIRNHGRESVSLIGSKASCHCMIVDGSPLRVKPGQTTKLRIGVRPGSEPGEFVQSLSILSDSPNQPIMRARVTWTINTSHESVSSVD